MKHSARARVPLLVAVMAAAGVTSCGDSGSNGGGDSTSLKANDASFTTLEEVAFEKFLDAEGGDGGITFRLSSSPSLGEATLLDGESGRFRYEPRVDAFGEDSFRFTATDNKGHANSATVTVTVQPVNDMPVAQGGCAAAPRGEKLTGFLAADDVESPDKLTFAIETPPSKGTLTLVDPTTGAFDYVIDDYRLDGADEFTYSVEDPDGGTATATHTIILTPRIMPLGDSITTGVVNINEMPYVPAEQYRVGYRADLYQTLSGAGFPFDFVGSQRYGWNDVELGDTDNEGYGGKDAVFLAYGDGSAFQGIERALDANPADIILLHIGTNGLDANTVYEVDELLDAIDRWEASSSGKPVTVVIAQIIERSDDSAGVAAFNDQLRDRVEQRIRENHDRLVLVDQHSALDYPYDIRYDGIHPTPEGYAKMAAVWAYPLTGSGTPTPYYTGQPLLSRCP